MLRRRWEGEDSNGRKEKGFITNDKRSCYLINGLN